MEKKTTFILVIVAIIAAIAIINYIKTPNQEITEAIIKCIASKSHLYGSSTCSHCEQQKEILGDYTSYFNITNCLDDVAVCSGKNIRAVPTWIINDAEYLGVKSLNELKTLAGC
ncbi:MAG: hypothetical protein NT076_01030 [Candidatus Pacearchaeota archaeon]|nr:hypothetical protein [Candidatus Pacearchaeota archaeon]